MDVPYTVSKNENGHLGRFSVMASPCEVLLESNDVILAKEVVHAVYTEAKRIEQKFSRYLNTNFIHAVNNNDSTPIKLDDESALLIDFAFNCFELSDGLFDVTSGILRRIWKFDGSDKIPSTVKISKLLPFIGLNKLNWQKPFLTMPKNMELDLGGIGKEYAVDRCLQKVLEINASVPVLLNFGGDLVCNGPRIGDKPWQVGIESVGGGKPAILSLKYGALATSGDARRFLIKDGTRYSHILNPKTGMSVIDAPSSITVAAQTCIEAGLMSTLAMLQGKDAQPFLQEQGISFWIQA